LGSSGGGDPVVVVSKIPWHATRLLVVEVLCTKNETFAAADSHTYAEPLLVPNPPVLHAPPIEDEAEQTVSVWWKPNSLEGLATEIRALRSMLAATDVLVYCGYAALPNGSFGVSPIAKEQTWGNVSLCAPAVKQAAAAGLRSHIMVEGRATLGFEAAVHRGGSSFGAEITQALGPLSQYPGLRGLSFDFEHKAGTHGRVNVSASEYADFLRGAGESAGLAVTVAASTGWPFMSNFSHLLSPTGGNASAVLDMALYHGENATQWASKLDAAIANAGATALPGAFGAGLSLRKGASMWEGTPGSVADRFRALESRGVRSVGIFEFTHGGLPIGLAPEIVAAWTTALRDFVKAGRRGAPKQKKSESNRQAL
jgi:hypothetical protein